MKKIILTIFIILFSFKHTVYGQTRTMDSLNLALKNAKHDTVKLKIYQELLNVCDAKDNLKYAEQLINQVNKLLPQTKDSLQRVKLFNYKTAANETIRFYIETNDGPNSPKLLSHFKNVNKEALQSGDLWSYTNSFLQIANYYSEQGNILKQLECLKQGLEIIEKKKYNRGKSRLFVQLEFFYTKQGDTLQALNYLEKAIVLEKEINDTVRFPRGYFITGNIYYELNRFDKALEFYFKSIKKYEALKDDNALIDLYLKVGLSYQAKKDFEKALIFLEKSNAISEKTNNLYGIWQALTSSGDLYKQRGNQIKTIEFHKLALKFCETAKTKPEEEQNVAQATAISCFHLANDYFYFKNINLAKQYFDRAYPLMKKVGSPRDLLDYERLGYKIDSASNNFKEAFTHYQKFLDLKNKFNNEDIHNAAVREKFQNDLEKQNLSNKAEQEKKDVLNSEEKSKQQFVIYGVAGILLLVIIFSSLLFKRFRLTNKQKGIIEQQKHIVEEKHKEITDSINYAERIQRSFLASTELLDNNLKEHFVYFQPKDVVSGDFYWANKLSNGNFSLVTADSTGHGVPGAIMSILNISCLEKSIDEQKLTEPSDILNHTRSKIIERLKKDGSAEGGKDGMDCSFVSFDLKNNQLTYSAANNPVWIVRENNLIELAPDKMPVGKHDKDSIPFTQHIIDLQKGDLVYTLTDGMPDQFGGPKGKKLMYKKLKELLISIAHLQMQQQHETLKTTLNNWKGELEQVDDICVIGVRI